MCHNVIITMSFAAEILQFLSLLLWTSRGIMAVVNNVVLLRQEDLLNQFFDYSVDLGFLLVN